MLALRKPHVRPTSTPASLPAPVGGWNARDALGEMAPTDAVYLTNWFPATSDVILRKGYSRHATGLPGQVESLLDYAGGATDKLFGASVTAIYDVTSPGAVGAAAVSGMTNARWQYSNIATSGGNFLLAFNGADYGLRYNGTTWLAVPPATGLTITSGSGTGTVSTLNVTAHGLLTGNVITVVGAADAGYNQASVTITRINANSFSYAGTGTGSTAGATYTVAEGISGVNPNTIIGVTLFKNRLWLTQKDTLNLWYLGTNSIAGAATAFPLQSIASEGGHIIATATWTIDAGYGVDDLFVIVTSKGQVIVYKGTDPSSATTWALVGIWNVGAPVGTRCLMKYAGDLLIICQDGLMPMSAMLQSSRVNPKVALTDKIQWAVSQSVSSYGSNFGWETLLFPKENMIFLNVPVAEGSTQEQYVMNTITGSWCRFTGWDANCWNLFQDSPYFGSNGYVGKAWDTFSDNGTNIVADAKQAFNYFGTRGLQKRFTMMRPVIATDGRPAVYAAVDVDYEDTFIAGPISYGPVTASLWDTALWDVGTWGGGLFIQRQWQGISGVGYCAAPRLKSATSGIEIHWISSDIVHEVGAIL